MKRHIFSRSKMQEVFVATFTATKVLFITARWIIYGY
jgi:hypothetical protein